MSARRTFWEHAGSLRDHLFVAVGFFLLAFVIIFIWLADTAVPVLLKPISGQPLIFLTPLGPFLFKMRVSLWLSACVSLPLWLGVLGHFVGETLSVRQRAGVVWCMFVAGTLAALSLIVSFSWLIPMSLKVLTAMTMPGISLTVTADSYLDFFLLICSTTLIIAELPLVLVFLTYIGLVKPHVLKRHRKSVYVLLLVVLAIVTPTVDMLTLTLIFCVSAVFLEAGLFVATLIHKNRGR